MLPNFERRLTRRQSFILSLWSETEEPGAWRFSLENPRTAERIGFKRLDELAHFLQVWTQRSAPKDFGASEKELAMSTEKQPTAMLLQPGEGQAVSALSVSLTFKTVGADSGGQWLAMEYAAPPHFAGPPLHYHKITTEIFYVLEGAMTFHVGAQTMQVGAGGFAYVPPGTVHGFSNQSDAPAKYFAIASPAGLEKYFIELQELIQRESQWPPKDMSKLIALMAKYDTFAPQAS